MNNKQFTVVIKALPGAFLALMLAGCTSISFGTSRVNIGGDMDGQTFVGGGGSAEILPEQDPGSGTRFGLGAGDGVFEFSVVRSNHDGQWLGIPTESTFQSLNFDMKLPFYGQAAFQPLAIVGLGVTSVKVRDGSTDGFGTSDATFKGLDLRFGLGARYNFLDNLALEGNATYRYGSYNHVDGIVSGSISDNINGDGTTLSAYLVYSWK